MRHEAVGGLQAGGVHVGTVDSATHELYVYDGRVDELGVYAPRPAATGRNDSVWH